MCRNMLEAPNRGDDVMSIEEPAAAFAFLLDFAYCEAVPSSVARSTLRLGTDLKLYTQLLQQSISRQPSAATTYLALAVVIDVSSSLSAGGSTFCIEKGDIKKALPLHDKWDVPVCLPDSWCSPASQCACMWARLVCVCVCVCVGGGGGGGGRLDGYISAAMRHGVA